MPEIDIKPIGDINAQFIIPDYQRGYRWEDFNVEQLLDDFYQFALSFDEGTTYFLQPVVVKKLNENTFEVVDGQQRLTTIYLLGKMLSRNEEDKLELKYELEYQTNKGLASFLRHITNPNSVVSEELYRSEPNKYYMYTAYTVMNKWFEEKDIPGPVKTKIRALLQPENKDDHNQKLVKVIWYETDSDDQENEFRKLNDYSIKLTNAELIKALILRYKKSGHDSDEEINKNQIITSAQWDDIETQLTKGEFFGFLTNEPQGSYDTKIDLLFELHFNRQHNSYNKYALLQDVEKSLKNNTEENLWDEIYHSFKILNSWYSNKELYHKIGFLVSISGQQIMSGLLQQSRNDKHSEFKASLDDKMRDKLKGFDFDNAAFGDEKIRHILILYNVVLILNNENNKNYFPFYLLKAKKWEVEHIQPRSDAEIKSDVKLWDEWVEKNTSLTDYGFEKYKTHLEAYRISKTRTNFDALYKSVIEEYSDKHQDWLNGIGNLCLLEKGANISVSNFLFKTKRMMIMDFDKEGEFIPLGTKNCFMRYFDYCGYACCSECADSSSCSDNSNSSFWTKYDRCAYIVDIKTILKKYLEDEMSREGDEYGL
ncbi:MAG: DUF262 domain-containing HNH endonuclease family protein [Oscillospiraceae bacterium]|nr:DUF262 domain-containing HNH endonuclease family protein [Oscillospiraceae bacterium]